MKKLRFTEDQVLAIVKEQDGGHFPFDSLANFTTQNYIYKLLKKLATFPPWLQ